MDIPIVNRYQPPIRRDVELWGPEHEYDLNFLHPIRLESLENDVVKLTPFVPRLHAQMFWDGMSPAAESLLEHIPWILPDLNAFLAVLETCRSQHNTVLFAVLDKTRPAPHESNLRYPLAGMIGLIRADEARILAEIGPVITLPAFQRTHVTGNSIGLLLRYCLDLPSASVPGIGLRRVVWTTREENPASVKAALRMGFKLEGVARWARVYPETKAGLPPRDGDPNRGVGVHAIELAICWDDWESGTRELVKKMMERR
jgi:RimJ/RimL family protein N-acetyltransferase